MNLFLLSQDNRVQGAASPKIDAPKLKTYLEPKYDQFGRQERVVLPPFLVHIEPTVLFTDIIQTSGYTFVSKQVKSILERYDQTIQFHSTVLIDHVHGQQVAYWIMEAPILDCLSEQSERNFDGTVTKIIIDEKEVASKPICCVKGLPNNQLVIHLSVAESLLRRDVFGISLTRVQTKGGEENVS